MSAIDILYRSAIRLHKQGKATDAAELYDAILTRQPDHYGALHLKGVLALQAGDFAAAVTLIERSIAIQPDHGLALANLAVAYRGVRQMDNVARVLRQSATLEPNSADVLADLMQALMRTGEIAEAVEIGRRALAIAPDHLDVQGMQLFIENYLADSDPVPMAERARKLGQQMERLAPPPGRHGNDADPERRLRIGLVSADLRRHPVGRFLAAILGEFDSTSIELFAYSGDDREDEVTARLQAGVPNWRNVTHLSDAALSARIVEDGIDILLDLSGHSAGNRLMVFAGKPAPVAATWIGYFATTGLTAIDYVLANRWVIPASEESQWVEKPWRLPDTYLCFSEPEDPPVSGPLSALANGYVTFGCFNNFNKLSRQTLAAWGRLMAAVPTSRLILRCSSIKSEGLAEQLDAAGIDPARVRIDAPIKNYAAHLRGYDEIDIALDPFPYNGGTTTVEALYMGVPVLVRAGDRYVAHMGESILHNAGLPDWIAADADAYVVLGAVKAADIEALVSLRAGFRDRMLKSPLFDAPRFARNLEDAFRGMWRIWCAAQRRA